MVLKTLRGNYNFPRRSYAVSLENDEMANEKQIAYLKNLIFQRCDENERERWLANIQDMTKLDIEEAIFNFLKMSW